MEPLCSLLQRRFHVNLGSIQRRKKTGQLPPHTPRCARPGSLHAAFVWATGEGSPVNSCGSGARRRAPSAASRMPLAPPRGPVFVPRFWEQGTPRRALHPLGGSRGAAGSQTTADMPNYFWSPKRIKSPLPQSRTER